MFHKEVTKAVLKSKAGFIGTDGPYVIWQALNYSHTVRRAEVTLPSNPYLRRFRQKLAIAPAQDIYVNMQVMRRLDPPKPIEVTPLDIFSWEVVDLHQPENVSVHGVAKRTPYYSKKLKGTDFSYFLNTQFNSKGQIQSESVNDLWEESRQLPWKDKIDPPYIRNHYLNHVSHFKQHQWHFITTNLTRTLITLRNYYKNQETVGFYTKFENLHLHKINREVHHQKEYQTIEMLRNLFSGIKLHFYYCPQPSCLEKKKWQEQKKYPLGGNCYKHIFAPHRFMKKIPDLATTQMKVHFYH